jgi:hypothetical protein
MLATINDDTTTQNNTKKELMQWSEQQQASLKNTRYNLATWKTEDGP